MNKVIGTATFAVVAAAMYWLCGNAHIDIFPCTGKASIRGPLGYTLQSNSDSCSLLEHNRGVATDGSYSKLTGAGWASLAAFCLGIGLVAGLGAGIATRSVGAARA